MIKVKKMIIKQKYAFTYLLIPSLRCKQNYLWLQLTDQRINIKDNQNKKKVGSRLDEQFDTIPMTYWTDQWVRKLVPYMD